MRAAQETILRLHNEICAIDNIIKGNESIFGGGVGEFTFLEMHICIGYMLPTIWGVCVS